MAKKSRGELLPKSPLKNLKEDAKEAKQLIKSLTTSVNAMVAAAKATKGALAGAKPKDVKSLKEFNDLTKQANATAQAKLKIDKQLLVEKERLKQLTQEQNKAIKEEVALAKTQKGSLERIRLTSKKLRNEKEKLNLTTVKGRDRLQQINRTLDKNNAILEKNATKLGKQKIGIGRYQKALGGLRRALGQLGLAFGVFSLIKDSFNVIANFEQAQANLASVLGVTTDKMKALTKQQKELGATTRFTASEVANLQTELAKLGFTQAKIEDMTPAVLALAEATGTELSKAAAVAGATLNGFGLESTDTQQVVDTMAKAFSTSSLDMEKFSVAMSSVAPVAKNAGFSIEQTTALLGTMTDRGIDASAAGTGLRNMFLDSGKAGLTLDEALEVINNSSDKTAKSFELFGKRGATLGVILAENTEVTAAQTKTLDENTEASLRGESAAGEMADTQRNTLGGALDLLRSAWEGLILSMDEAGGVGETLRIGIRFLADNLGTIVKVMAKVVKFFIIYKTTLAAIKLRDKIRDQIAYNKALKATGEGAKGAGTGVKAFGQALKSIAIAAAIALIIELAQAFWAAASGANALADANRRLARQREISEKKATKRIKDRTDQLAADIKEAEQAAELARKAAKTAKERAKIDKDLLDKKEALIAANKKVIVGDIELANKKKQALKDDKALIKTIKARLDAGKSLNKEQKQAVKTFKLVSHSGGEILADALTGTVTGVDKFTEKINELTAEISGTNIRLTLYNDELNGVSENLGDVNHEQELLNVNIPKTTKGVKKLNTELDEYNEILSRQLELLHDLDQLDFGKRVREVQERIDEGVSNLISINLLKEMVDEKNAILREAALNRQEFEIATIIETNRIESETELQKLKDNKDKLLAQEGLTKAQIEDIEAQHQAQLEQLEMDELQRAADLELEIRAIKLRTSEELIELKKAENAELNTINDELVQNLSEKDEEITDNEEEELKKRLENQNKFIKATEQAITQSIDRRIKKIEEESEAAQRQFDFLSGLAESGNIKASQSLAEEQRIIDEAALEKERLERRKQNILLVSSVLQAYNSNLAAGDDSNKAFAKAVTSTEVITQFISALPGYFDGVEDTGDQGIFRDKHGVITGYTHKNERVIDERRNARIGDASNEEVARTMEAARLGKMSDGIQLAVNDNGELVEQMKVNTSAVQSLERVLINKPEHNTETGKLIRDVLVLRDSTTKGGKTTQRTYRVE